MVRSGQVRSGSGSGQDRGGQGGAGQSEGGGGVINRRQMAVDDAMTSQDVRRGRPTRQPQKYGPKTCRIKSLRHMGTCGGM